MQLRALFGSDREYGQKFRRWTAPAAALVVMGGTVFGASGIASAASPDTNTGYVTAVGSFTIFQMDHDLFPNSLNDTTPGVGNQLSGTGMNETNVADSATGCTTPSAYLSGGVNPNGSGAGKTALVAQESAASSNNNCIQFARSSSSPGPTDPSTNLDYYAFALDGVAPLVGNGVASGVAPGSPVTLTLTDMKDIYNCTYTNWGQVQVGVDGSGHAILGANENITRFWPQPGSGTRAVYQDILGFDPTATGTGSAVAACNATGDAWETQNGGEPYFQFSGVTGSPQGTSTPVNEENTEDGIIYLNKVQNTTHAYTGEATDAVLKGAIYIYSAGKFASQWDDTTDFTSTATNNIDGASEGNFNSTLSLANMKSQSSNTSNDFLVPESGGVRNSLSFALNSSVIDEANEWYSNIPAGDTAPADSTSDVPGVRYVFNVADKSLPSYNLAKMMIGFDNQATGVNVTGLTPDGVGAVSALCANQDSNVIVNDGFIALDNTSGPSGSNQAGSYCREFPGGSFPGQGGSYQWTTPIFVPEG